MGNKDQDFPDEDSGSQTVGTQPIQGRASTTQTAIKNADNAERTSQSEASPTTVASPAASPASGEESPSKDKPKSAREIAASLDANMAQTVAIVDFGNSIKSLKSTSDQVKRAETQSPSMQQGAQVAHDNALQRFLIHAKAAFSSLEESVYNDVKAALVKLHDAGEIVGQVLAEAGVERRPL